ncbi:MAG TPA: PQQ-dependent sugar dehydrogenase [Solirubrobacterales bacterium]|nr:PQQ-dependent sugar dehydrogenase [Solirubrobacterales bacterium]
MSSEERGARSLRSLERGVVRALVLLLLAACCLLLAGCGGDDLETGTVTTPTDGDGATTTAVGDGVGGVELVEIGSFDAPLYVTQPEGDGEDVYVVEQGGTVQRVAPDGTTSTFLDISDETEAEGEQGLLSMAFAPDYAKSGLFYVDYTNLDGDTRVVEYRARNGKVDESSARQVLAVDQPYPNHNGGLVLFGPDGKLYIGLGDGGAKGDPERRGLDLSTLLGKILRIDPRPDGDRPYTIPSDNPFVDEPGARPEIYSYGLRNPWRFAFDRETEDFSIGDVGQDVQEEIDLVARGKGSGANFGWSAWEGTERFNEDQDPDGAIPPVLTAFHADGNCSITGGLTVRDPDLTTLYGRYLYGDLCVGVLRSFTARPERPAKDDVAVGPEAEVPRLSSFGEGTDGTVYVVSLAGPVYRLDPAR